MHLFLVLLLLHADPKPLDFKFFQSHFAVPVSSSLTTAQKSNLEQEKENAVIGKSFAMRGAVDNVLNSKKGYWVYLECGTRQSYLLLVIKSNHRDWLLVKKGQSVNVSGTISKADWLGIRDMYAGSRGYRLKLESQDAVIVENQKARK